MSLLHLPEEILDKILSTTLSAEQKHSTLLVCRAFHRIGLPHFWRRVRIDVDSKERDYTSKAHWIREVDIVLSSSPSDIPLDTILHTLPNITTLRILTCGSGVYLTLPHVRGALFALSTAVSTVWPALRAVHIGLRLTDTPACSALIRSIAVHGRVAHVVALLPSVWSAVLAPLADVELIVLVQGHSLAPACRQSEYELGKALPPALAHSLFLRTAQSVASPCLLKRIRVLAPFRPRALTWAGPVCCVKA